MASASNAGGQAVASGSVPAGGVAAHLKGKAPDQTKEIYPAPPLPSAVRDHAPEAAEQSPPGYVKHNQQQRGSSCAGGHYILVEEHRPRRSDTSASVNSSSSATGSVGFAPSNGSKQQPSRQRSNASFVSGPLWNQRSFESLRRSTCRPSEEVRRYYLHAPCLPNGSLVSSFEGIGYPYHPSDDTSSAEILGPPPHGACHCLLHALPTEGLTKTKSTFSEETGYMPQSKVETAETFATKDEKVSPPSVHVGVIDDGTTRAPKEDQKAHEKKRKRDRLCFPLQKKRDEQVPSQGEDPDAWHKYILKQRAEGTWGQLSPTRKLLVMFFVALGLATLSLMIAQVVQAKQQWDTKAWFLGCTLVLELFVILGMMAGDASAAVILIAVTTLFVAGVFMSGMIDVLKGFTN